MKNYYSLPMDEVLQAAGMLNLLNNSLKNTKYFSHSYYLLFILFKLTKAKVRLFRHYECTNSVSLP